MVKYEIASPRNSIGARNDMQAIPTFKWQFHLLNSSSSVTLKALTTVNNGGQAAAELDALLPSILDRAFRGEL
jgi:hypothetical protein